MANMPTQPRKDEPRQGSTLERASDVMHRAQESATGVADRARDAASSATQAASDFASNVGQKARDAMSSASQSAGDYASTAKNKAQKATASMGSGMQHLAGSMRENLPHEGVFGRATSAVADTLESGGRFLEEEGLGGLFDELGQVVRRHPVPSILVAMGLGFLLARSVRS